jgi:hypothetical protein
MKTALYITDCSADSALRLRQWLTAQTNNAIRLTIVFPYDVEPGLPLTRNTFNPVKEVANQQLKSWSEALEGTISSETVLATPDLALTIYLLLRSYTYWLSDSYEQVTQFADLLAKTSTEVCCLPS